jgi:hypothetical protein
VPVRYSSACSCAGVTSATTVAPSPTSTGDYTTTVTVSSFLIIASGAPFSTPEFLQLSTQEIGPENSETHGFASDITDASGFEISGSQLQILANGDLSDDDSPVVAEPLFFDSASTISSQGYTPVDVTVGQDLRVALVNTANGDSIIEDCAGLLNVGATAGGTNFLGESCQVIGLSIVPL